MKLRDTKSLHKITINYSVIQSTRAFLHPGQVSLLHSGYVARLLRNIKQFSGKLKEIFTYI